MEEDLKEKRNKLRKELEEIEILYKDIDKKRWKIHQDLLELEMRILGVWKK